MSAHFIWYELMTTDASAAAEFYGEVVGWTIPDQSQTPPPMDYRMIGRSDGGNAGGVLGLSPEMTAGGATPCWVGYLAAGDVDALLVSMQADGAQVIMPAFDLPVGRIAMVADPQGAVFYVMKPIPPEGQHDAASDVFDFTRPQHVRWNELSTSDPEAALAFYGKHFGLTPAGEMDMGAMGTYRFIAKGGQAIGAVMPKAQELPVSMWTYYIGVDDIDRAAGEVNVQGGKVLFGPHEIPGGEFSAVCIDRQGATFGIVGPRNG